MFDLSSLQQPKGLYNDPTVQPVPWGVPGMADPRVMQASYSPSSQAPQMNASDLFMAQNLGLNPQPMSGAQSPYPAMVGAQAPMAGPQNVQMPAEVNHLADVVQQYTQNKQDQNNNSGLVQQILSNRMQPSLADASQAATQSAQSFLAPNLFKPQTADQAMAERYQNQLAPYTQGLGLANTNASLSGELMKNQITSQTGLPAALADIALKKAQTNFFNQGGQGAVKPEPVFDASLNGGQGGFRFAMANELRQNPNLMPASSVPPGAKLSAFNAAPSPKAQQIFADANLDPRVPPLTAEEQKDNEADYKNAVSIHDAAMAASSIATKASEPAKNYAAGPMGSLAGANAMLPQFLQNQSLQNTQLLNKYSGQIAMQLAQQSKGIRIGVGMEKFAKSTTIDPNNSPPVNQTIIQNIQAMPSLTQQQKNMEAYLKQLSPQYKEAVRDQFYNDYPMMVDNQNSDVAVINPAYKDPNLFRKWISGNIESNQSSPPADENGIRLPGSANDQNTAGSATHKWNPATQSLEPVQ